MANDYPVAQAIRKLLTLRGYSIRQFAEGIKLPYRTVQNYLLEDARIPASFVRATCDYLAVEADYLFFWGVDVERESFDAMIADVFAEAFQHLEYKDGKLLPLSEDHPSRRSERELLNHARSMVMIVAPVLRDEYISRRIRALKDEGRAGVYPRDEARLYSRLNSPSEVLP